MEIAPTPFTSHLVSSVMSAAMTAQVCSVTMPISSATRLYYISFVYIFVFLSLCWIYENFFAIFLYGVVCRHKSRSSFTLPISKRRLLVASAFDVGGFCHDYVH